MEPALAMGALSIVFVGLHVGLAARRPRAALVARLGEGGFTAVFSVAASLAFAALVAFYAAHRLAGAPGLALAGVPLARVVLIPCIVAGVALMSAALAGYGGSPYDLFDPAVRRPRGLERITRHPFFAGLTLFAGAHALLATRLVGTIVFGALALLAAVGPWHQDRKLLARRGGPFADYLAATSALPFAAIVAGRQRWSWREQPVGALAIGVALALLLRRIHDGIFAAGGAWVIAAVVGGAAGLTWQSVRRSRRAAGRGAGRSRDHAEQAA